MDYSLRALIAAPKVMAPAKDQFPSTRIVPLACGLSMVPLTTALLDEVHGGEELATSVPGFLLLSSSLIRWVASASELGPIAYVEAEFYSKIRSESCSVWENGNAVLGPLHEKGAIGRALGRLGIGGGDPFESAGLGKYKSTEDWLRDAR